MAELDTDKDGFLSFEDVRKMMHQQKYLKVNTGRHFVALSLEEAEFVRAVMHSMQPASINEGISLKKLYYYYATNSLHNLVAPNLESDSKNRITRKATTISTTALLSNTDLAFGLRINGRTLLDSAGEYPVPPTQQLATSAQCYRFINSELHYNRYILIVTVM